MVEPMKPSFRFILDGERAGGRRVALLKGDDARAPMFATIGPESQPPLCERPAAVGCCSPPVPIGLGIYELTFLDGRVSARLAPDHLRRLPVGAENGTSHSVAITESGLLRDNVKGVVGILQQRARPFEAEVLDRFGRCLAGFNLEGAAELAR